MPVRLRIALAASLACVAGAAPRAHAAAGAPHGKLRVSLDTEVFSWTQARPSYAFMPPIRTTTLGFGAGRPTSIDGRPFPGGSVLALALGYGVHKHLVLGARFGMNLTHTFTRNPDPTDERNDDATTLFVGTVTPYLEILPRAEGRVLPFLLVRTGFTGTRSIVRDGVFWDRSGSIAPQVGAGAGVHAFVTRAVSIDAAVTFDYRWVFARARTGGGPDDPGVPLGWSRSGQSLILAATLGLSTWF